MPKTDRQRAQPVIFKIGHSTRPIDEFVALLRAHGIRRVIDIRTIPKARHNPQFNREAPGPALRASRIVYVHLKALGGLRRALPNSKNIGWHNASFRGFADDVQTPEFRAGLARALKLAAPKPGALMCAEAVPWRCHRSLVAEALLVRGYQVGEIIGTSAPKPNKITPFARIRGNQITDPTDKRTDPRLLVNSILTGFPFPRRGRAPRTADGERLPLPRRVHDSIR